MGGQGDPYLVPVDSMMQGELRQLDNAILIIIPHANQKTPEQIGKIAENLAENWKENPD